MDTEKDSFKEIKAYLDNSKNLSEEELINAVIAIGNTGDEDAIPFLLDLFRDKNNSNHLIQSAAIALAKLGTEQIVDPIIAYLRDDRFLEYRGGFLYALKFLECKKYFQNFVEMFSTGGFNVQEISYTLIKKYYLKMDNSVLKAGIESLERKKEELYESGYNKEIEAKVGFMNQVIEMFESKIGQI